MVTMLLWLPSAGLGYFYLSCDDKINLVMFIYSGLLFLECHLAIVVLANCCFLYLIAGAKIRREEKKERKKILSFLLGL
jgi:hypothetical protein